MTDSPLLFAKVLDGAGGAQTLTEIPDTLGTAPLWLHFDVKHPQARESIRRAAPDIDDNTLLALFSQEARPRTLALENGTLVILRGINHNEGQDPEDMVAVRFWITDRLMISTRFRKLKAVSETSENLTRGLGPKTIGDIFTQISVAMLGFIENTIGQLHDSVDDLESRILQEPDRELRQNIVDIRKSAIMLRRYIAPQKEAINQLRFAEVRWLNAKNLRRIQESQETLTRNIEDLDAIRERAQVVKDELMNTLSDKLNRNLYMLSVVTSVFLPLGFLTGLFGINIGGMPGVDRDSAFMIFVGALVALLAVQIAIFKWFRWF